MTFLPGGDSGGGPTISEVLWSIAGDMLRVWWTSSDPPGTYFQVYLNNHLVHPRWPGDGTRRSILLPYPDGPCSLLVGTVDPADATTDFSGSLPAPAGTGRIPNLQWYGGRYLAEDLTEFRLYRSAAAGGPIDYTAPFTTILAFPGSVYNDGAGRGRAGRGGAGRSEVTFVWSGDPLSNGVWLYGVRAVDSIGNEVTISSPTWSFNVAAPPGPPALNAAGKRLSYTYSSVTHKPTLTWSASPG